MEEKVDACTDNGERVFCLKDEQINTFKSWQNQTRPLRSSERWRRKQRINKIPTLPDVRHQIAKLLNNRLL